MSDTDRDLDPGAFIGHEPELASERIPGGVQPDDDRVAFNSSQRAVDGEPGIDEASEPPAPAEAGQDR
jgi:hypothetical protein